MSYVRLDDEQIVPLHALIHEHDVGGNLYMLQSKSFQQLLDKLNYPSETRTLCSTNNVKTDDVPLAPRASAFRRCLQSINIPEHLQKPE